MSDESAVEHTADGRYIVVNGRRWRATDPAIPADRAQELRNELMAARRDVARANRTGDDELTVDARARVQTAKVALGERGEAWWDQTMDERRLRWSLNGPVGPIRPASDAGLGSVP